MRSKLVHDRFANVLNGVSPGAIRPRRFACFPQKRSRSSSQKEHANGLMPAEKELRILQFDPRAIAATNSVCNAVETNTVMENHLSVKPVSVTAPRHSMGRVIVRTLGQLFALFFFVFTQFLSQPGQAQSVTVVTDPVGFYMFTMPSNSDTIVSIPFTRPANFVGLITVVTGNVISVAGSVNWSPNQYVYSAGIQSNTYFAFINTGPSAGIHYPITNNTANSLGLDLGGANLTNVSAGASLAIIPYWTLGTALPLGGGILDSPTPGHRATEILIPDFTGVGTNLSASQVYYHWNGNWRAVGQGNAPKDDVVLRSDSYFIVRQNLASNTVLTTFGLVPTRALQVSLATAATTKRDNSVALARPALITLTQSMLFESGAFNASPATNARTDELLVVDNLLGQKNKTPAAVYYYWSNAWRQVGAGTNDVGSAPVFAPGVGVIVRKNTTVGAPTYQWVNSPNY